MRIRSALQVGVFAVTIARGQTLSHVGLPASDVAVLNSHEHREELLCTVQPTSPKLGFDLNFHSGFAASVPLRQFSGIDTLTVIFRVSPTGRAGEPTYFSQQWTIGPVGTDTLGDATVQGWFVSGLGKYQIAWLMRDREERFCSAQWEVSADTRGRDRKVQTGLPSGTVQPEMTELFGNEVVKREGDHGLKILVLLHISPRVNGPFEKRSEERFAVVSMVRRIAREPRIAAVAIEAFNLERSEVLYRGRISPQVDFRALGNAIQLLNPHTVDFHRLRENDSGAHIVGELVHEGMMNRPDAIIIVGPRTVDDRLDARASSIELKAPPCPVFYLDYVPGVSAPLSRDPIGRMVKHWNGFEYKISKPRDLFAAWNEVMGRVSNVRAGVELMARN